MARRRGNRIFPALGLCALLIAAFAAGPAMAADPGEKALADRVAKTYGVKVLKIGRGEQDGKPILLVTVMNAGGNYNAAFQVTTLALDPKTGRLLSQFRHTASGDRRAPSINRSPSTETSGATTRRWSTRPQPGR